MTLLDHIKSPHSTTRKVKEKVRVTVEREMTDRNLEPNDISLEMTAGEAGTLK